MSSTARAPRRMDLGLRSTVTAAVTALLVASAAWFAPASGAAAPAPLGASDAAVTVSAGGSHTCALVGSGAVDCWGAVADGRSSDAAGPFSSVAAGLHHTCAVTVSGSVDCWGDDALGQATDQPGPFSTVAAGHHHSCGLTSAGAAECWGLDNDGQATDRPGPFTSLVAGGYHSCGLTSTGSVDCWGHDSDGRAADRAGPYTAVAAGWTHTCGLTLGGAVECWGGDVYGQAADEAGPFSAVSAGGSHTCGLTTTGAIECWGADFVGQSEDRPGPFAAVSAGVNHTCGLGTDGYVTCWGETGSLRLGMAPWVRAVKAPPAAVGVPYLGSVRVAPTRTTTREVPMVRVAVASGALPDGLSLDPLTGAITGTPTESGRYSAVVAAVSATGRAETTVAIDVATPRSISGTVTVAGGSPAPGTVVAAYDSTDRWVPSAATTTDAEGRYSLTGLDSGVHRVVFVAPTGASLATEWFDGVASRTEASPVTVTATRGRIGVDAELSEDVTPP